MGAVVTTGAISRAKLQSHHHRQQTNIQFFYRPDALPVTQPTVSKHWMEYLSPSISMSYVWPSHYYFLFNTFKPPQPTQLCYDYLMKHFPGRKKLQKYSATVKETTMQSNISIQWCRMIQLQGSVKVPNILIFFSAHHSIVFCFRCSVYWWKESVLKYY